MLVRSFVSGVTWSVRASSGKTLLVLTRGFPRVEMKASLRCWFRDVTALARSWTS